MFWYTVRAGICTKPSGQESSARPSQHEGGCMYSLVLSQCVPPRGTHPLLSTRTKCYCNRPPVLDLPGLATASLIAGSRRPWRRHPRSSYHERLKRPSSLIHRLRSTQTGGQVGGQKQQTRQRPMKSSNISKITPPTSRLFNA